MPVCDQMMSVPAALAVAVCAFHCICDKLCALPMQMGFFAEAGPVELFVSQHLIPGHYAFDNASEPIYESNEGSPGIRVGSTVRVRVLRAKEEITTIVRAPSAVSSAAGFCCVAFCSIVLSPASCGCSNASLRCLKSGWEPCKSED